MVVLLALLSVVPVPAAAAPPIDVRQGVGVGERRARGTVPVTTGNVFSRDNANRRFVIWLALPDLPADAWPYLTLDGVVIAASSTGSGSSARDRTATFQVDRGRAKAAAAHWGVPLQEREPLGQGLRATWRVSGPAAPGKPIPVVLRLENRGTRPVRLMVGGRQRGLRNNRFHFTARRDGRALPVKEAEDFGGLATHHEIPVGGAYELSVDLRLWVDPVEPGTYEVACRYEGELFPPEPNPGQWPERAHRTWDLVLEGAVRLTVVAARTPDRPAP